MVALVTGLITPRLILGAFGSTYNGASSSIAQFLSMISILTMGLAGATRVELYKTLAANDIEGTSRVVKATEKSFKRVGYALVLYTIILVFVMPLVLKDEIPLIDIILLVLIAAVSSFGNYYFGQTYYLLLQADQREYLSTTVLIFVNILHMLIAVILIPLGASVIVVKFANALLSLSYPIFMYYFVRRRYKLITNIDASPRILKQRGAAMFHSIANIVHDNTSVLILSLFSTAATVSVFVIYNSIVKNLKQLMQNFTAGLEGAFGNIWAKGDKDLFRTRFGTYEFLSFSFSSIVFTCTGLLLLPFMTLYTRNITDANYLVLSFAILVTVSEGVFCIRQPYVTIVQAAGKYKETKIGAMIEAGINLAVAIVLVNLIGLNGVIIGTLVANVFRTCQYAIFASGNILSRSIFVFLRKILWHAGNTALTVLLYKLVEGVLPIDSWFLWVVHGAICFAIASAVTLLSAFLFYRKELRHTWGFVCRALQKRKKKAAAS